MGKSQVVERVGALLGRWGVAALWVTLPVVAGPTLADALDDTTSTFSTTVASLVWLTWGAVLAASLVPRVSTLTAVRIAVPAAPIALAWAALSVPDPGGGEVAAVTISVLAAIVSLAPQTADRFIDGSSYGIERRMALRAPGQLLLGPIELAWLVVVVAVAAGPLLLADTQWVAGALALVVGWPIAFVGVRALHSLAQRWLVFTEAGLVVVDRFALADTLLATRRALVSVGPAPADTDALDLTVRALGLALELRFGEAQTVAPAGRGRRRPPPPVSTRAVLVSPTLPGQVLTEARRRRLPVQTAMPPPTTSSFS